MQWTASRPKLESNHCHCCDRLKSSDCATVFSNDLYSIVVFKDLFLLFAFARLELKYKFKVKLAV